MGLLDGMNEPQREAILTTRGPLLILAGAGSGKTRVLTHRTAYLIQECGVNPYNILAITFTNKAAGEMRERIDRLVGMGSESIWVSTFHSMCVRILRRHIDRLGYDTNFTIYDTDDAKTVMKDVCKRLEINTKLYKERMFLSVISSLKNEMIDPITFQNQAVGDYTKRIQADVYAEYQRVLRLNNALDFDDLLLLTVELFKQDKEVLSYYQNRFQYIMVDEYQDTNTVQFELIRLLAMYYKNLCVVGDDDQSIYKFRGANINNILNFERYFDGAKVIKLEQNYRSTQNILDAANSVIANNVTRKEKRLWTDNGSGDPIRMEQFDTGYEEADYVVRDIARRVRKGEYAYRDCAILYRTNAQSRLFEEKFLVANIPYKIVGGVNFYSRKEVKDILAYLKTVDNGHDDIAVNRILNVPKRGIGKATIDKVTYYADIENMDFYEALKLAGNIPTIGKAAAKIEPFVNLIEGLRERSRDHSVVSLIEDILEKTGYTAELSAEGTDEAEQRIQNIDELISKAAVYEEGAENPTLRGFLEEVALVADIDSLGDETDYVVLMTLHSAKGLEFPNVYLTGLEDGLFPSYMAITSDELDGNGVNSDVEEERRLCYVGITRAKQHLTMTAAKSRMIRGNVQYNALSRFVKEIPAALLKGNFYRGRSDAPGNRGNADSFEDVFAGGVGRAGSRSGFETGRAPGRGSMFGSGEALNRKKSQLGKYVPPSKQREFESKNTIGKELGYGVGDRVRHMKFGEGIVTAVVQGGKDFEVTVDFETVGTRKMFAVFARLKKVE